MPETTVDTIWLAIYVFSPLIVILGIPAGGLAIGFWIDREHRASLDYRRREVGHVLITDLSNYPGWQLGQAQPELIVGEVVLSCNTFIASLGRIRMIFGGEVRTFHGLLTRARQEAVLRVMEQAAGRGLDAVCNLRLEAVDISGQSMRSRNQRTGAGVYLGLIAYGEAYKRAPGIFPPAAPPTLMDYPQ